MSNTPKISVTVKPETLDSVLTTEFQNEADRLVKLHNSAPEILERLISMVFLCETVAHMRGLERELLPHTDAAREFIASFK